MKVRLIALTLACFFLSACLDLDVKVGIGKDWSGDLALKVEMLDQTFQMITSPQVGEQMGMDFSLINEKELRALVAEHGGQVRKFNNTVENGIRTIDMLASVPSVRKLLEETGGDQLGIRKEGDHYVLFMLDGAAMNTFLNMEDELLEQQLNMLAPTLTGLKLKLEVSVPELVDTNLTRKGNSAVFAVDFDKDIAGKTGRQAVLAFKQLLTPKSVSFKGPAAE